MSENALEEIIIQVINGAVSTIPAYLEDIKENKDILKVENPQEFVYGIVMGMALGMGGAILSSQKRSANHRRSNENKRDRIQTHTRNKRTNIQLIEFNQKEIDFLKSLEEARIATSHNDIPHVKPVSFVFYDKIILVATDYNTRTFSNIKSNSNTGIVIDIYKSGNHKAICIQGKNRDYRKWVRI